MVIKNALLTDILRDIRKYAGRFAGIFFIVALGVFIFVGLGSTGALMQEIGNKYFTQQRFYDLRVVSTYGLNKNDIVFLEEIEGVTSVYPAYNLDALAKSPSNSIVVKIHSFDTGPDMDGKPNMSVLCSGRFPDSDGECMVEQKLLDMLNLSIGDNISLSSGKDETIQLLIKRKSYKIVGIVQSPLYFALGRGTSSIGNGQVDCYMYIPVTNFKQTTYSEAFLEIGDLDGVFCYDQLYADTLDQIEEQIRVESKDRLVARKHEAQQNATLQLSTMQLDLDKLKESLTQSIADSTQTLDLKQKSISGSKINLIIIETNIANGLVELDAQEEAVQSSILEALDGLDQVQAMELNLNRKQADLYESEAELDEQEELLANNKYVALGYSISLDSNMNKAQNALNELQGTQAELDTQRNGLRQKKSALEKEIAALYAQLNDEDNSGNLEQVEAELENCLLQMETLEEYLALLLNHQNQLDAYWAEIHTAINDIENGENEVADALAQITSGRIQILGARMELEDGQRQLTRGRLALKRTKGELEDQLTQLQSSLTEIGTMRATLHEAGRGIPLNRQQLLNAQELVNQNITDLSILSDEYEAQFTTAQVAINTNRHKIYDMQDPKWYIFDRDDNNGYARYDSAATELYDLGRLVPILFFLVAALVSLTTMSRLVEEQRKGIGILKALGFNNGTILLRYALYAVVPTSLGGIIGGVSGLYVFPTVILKGAYGGIYAIPDFVPTINIPYLLTGLLLAVASTLFTTMYTCYRELNDVPATLMRPKAPSIGQKTPLEYIGVLWCWLSFNYKTTFRNIFRYKKRLLMTIIGVGGCTALLTIGLGLNDSISDIMQNQYTRIQKFDTTVSFVENTSQSTIKSVLSMINADSSTQMSTQLRGKQMDVVSANGMTESASVIIPKSPEELYEFIAIQDRDSGAPLELTDEGAIINEKLASVMGIDLGDTVVIKDDNDNEAKIRIMGVCEYYMMHAVYISETYYQRAFGSAPDMNTIYIKNSPFASSVEINRLSEAILDKSGVSAVVAKSVIVEQYGKTLASFKMVIWLIIILAASLAFVVLMNLTTINIAERTRELATIEVLGFHDMESAMYIYRESLIVSFVCALIGVFSGRFLHLLLAGMIESSNMMFGRQIKPISFIIAVGLTMIFTIVVDFITSRRIRSIDMIEALKSLE